MTKQNPKEPQIYKVSKWNGIPNFECVFCPYSTLDEEDARTHYEKRHAPPPPPPPPPSLIPIFDRWGNEVKSQPAPDGAKDGE